MFGNVDDVCGHEGYVSDQDTNNILLKNNPGRPSGARVITYRRENW